MSPDEEFAIWLEALGAEALMDGQYEDAGYFFDASDWHWPPSDEVLSNRVTLLLCAMGSRPAGERAR